MNLSLYRTFLLAMLALVMAGCGHKNTSAEAPQVDTVGRIVAGAHRCSRLWVAEYKVHKIVTHADKAKIEGSMFGHDYSITLPLGERKAAIPIDASLRAYIDMSLLSEDDIRVEGRKVEILLPNPQVVISSVTIDHEGTKKHVALLRTNFKEEELAAYVQLGRKAIADAVPAMGIESRARVGAAKVLIPMIAQLGFSEADITITFRDNAVPNIIENTDKELQNKAPLNSRK